MKNYACHGQTLVQSERSVDNEHMSCLSVFPNPELRNSNQIPHPGYSSEKRNPSTWHIWALEKKERKNGNKPFHVDLTAWVSDGEKNLSGRNRVAKNCVTMLVCEKQCLLRLIW